MTCPLGNSFAIEDMSSPGINSGTAETSREVGRGEDAQVKLVFEGNDEKVVRAPVGFDAAGHGNEREG